MIPQKYLIILVSIFALTGGAFVYGYTKGTTNEIKKAVEAKQALQEELLDLNDDLMAKNAEILRLTREREGLIDELENQAITADGSSAPGIATTGGLQRLERRWGSSPTTP